MRLGCVVSLPSRHHHVHLKTPKAIYLLTLIPNSNYIIRNEILFQDLNSLYLGKSYLTNISNIRVSFNPTEFVGSRILH